MARKSGNRKQEGNPKCHCGRGVRVLSQDNSQDTDSKGPKNIPGSEEDDEEDDLVDSVENLDLTRDDVLLVPPTTYTTPRK